MLSTYSTSSSLYWLKYMY